MAPKRAPERPAGHQPPWALAAVTQIVPETAQACWEIRSYSLLEKKKLKRHISPVILEAAGARWRLNAYFRGAKESPEGDFGLFAERDNDSSADAVPVYATVKIQLVGAGGTGSLTYETEPELFPAKAPKNEVNNWGFNDFGKIASLESPQYLINDTLVLGLQVTAWTAQQERAWQLPAAPGSSGSAAAGAAAAAGLAGKKQGDELAEDLAALLASGQAADVEVRGGLAEESEPGVKAHRLVLAARSPVFNRMLLESGMRESQSGAKIPLEDVDQTVAEQFVRFLYTNKLDQKFLDSSDALCHLLVLGHRFGVCALVRLCSAHLTISEDTALERLMMAEQFGLATLKEQAMDFLCSCRSRMAKAQKTEAFKRMVKNNPQLMAELFTQAMEPEQKRPRVSSPAAP